MVRQKQPECAVVFLTATGGMNFMTELTVFAENLRKYETFVLISACIHRR